LRIVIECPRVRGQESNVPPFLPNHPEAPSYNSTTQNDTRRGKIVECTARNAGHLEKHSAYGTKKAPNEKKSKPAKADTPHSYDRLVILNAKSAAACYRNFSSEWCLREAEGYICGRASGRFAPRKRVSLLRAKAKLPSRHSPMKFSSSDMRRCRARRACWWSQCSSLRREICFWMRSDSALWSEVLRRISSRFASR